MKYLLLLPFLLLAGCGQLRKPFCTEPLTALPPEFQGSYEIVAPVISPDWSGIAMLRAVQVEVQSKGVLASKAVTSVPEWSEVCRVDGRLILQEQNANGTYSLTEITKTGDRVIFSPIAIDADLARKAGFKLQYVPDFRTAVNAPALPTTNNGTTSFESGFVLDNTSLTPEQVLSVSRLLSFDVVFRATAQKKFKPMTTLRFEKSRIVGE